MLFIRYSFDPGATISIQFIQKTPEYYSNVFAHSVCIRDATCKSRALRHPDWGSWLPYCHAIAKLQAPSHVDANITPSEKEAVKVFKITAADEEEEAKSDIPQMEYAERKLREDADRLLKK